MSSRDGSPTIICYSSDVFRTAGVFGVLSVGFLIYVRLRVPETKGRTFEAIEADLRQTSRRVA